MPLEPLERQSRVGSGAEESRVSSAKTQLPVNGERFTCTWSNLCK